MSTALQPSDCDPDGDPLVAGHYRVLRALKVGAGTTTVLAEDVRDGTQVVIKSVDTATVDLATRRRFEHEIQILRTLVGLGLPGLRDAGETGGRLYLTQPYLGGSTLERLLTDGPLPVPDALRIGLAVAATLDVAHSAGICHRDVKPANILVEGASVSLVDFGLARSAHLDTSLHDEMVGTIRYLAPESAGLLPVPPDERSDLYALGVVLFECLVGRPPFAGPTVRDLLRQHLSAPPPPLRADGRPMPRAVEALVHRLLRKEPSERYQSAAAVAADLGALADLLASGATDPAFVIGRADRRRALTDPSFVGRAAELADLNSFVDDVAAGTGGAILLEADSGGGKSRLLDEVIHYAEHAGVRVLRGQGVALAGQRPFAMLHGLADELARTLDPDEQAALRRAVGAVAPSVVRALPALADVLQTSAHLDVGPEEFGELRSMVALARMIAAVARPDRPLLLVFDDCQWADTLTVRLFNELYAGPAAPKHLGMIAAFRSDEVARTHPLRRINAARPLRLGPLPADAMTLLVESMAGPVPAEALDIVLRLADGNPFMGAAVLRGMVETGALVGGDDGWTVDPGRLEDVQAARRSAAFLVRRLELLSDDSLRLLSVGAVLGKHFDLDVAVEVADRPADALEIIESARRSRLLWIDEPHGRWRFFHDKIREALIDRLEEGARRELHSRAADALAARAADDADGFVFDLAYHLDAAGRHADALPHALAGAALARERYALDTAVAHYRMAENGVPASDVGTRIAVAEGLGDVLTLQGVYAEAQDQFVLARSLVVDIAHAAALETKLGELAFKRGDITGAKQHLEGALGGLGRHVPRSNTVFLVRVLWEALVQAMHTIFPRRFVGRRVERPQTDALAMRIYSRLAYLYWFHSGRVACAWAHLRGMNLAERYGASAELAQSYSEHAPVMTTLPWYARGRTYVARSLRIRRDLGDVWGEGQSLGFTAVVEYAAGDWTAAENAAENAIALLERTGDQWEVNTARWHRGMCQWRTGRLADAAETARETFLFAQSIGDQTSAGISFSVWVRAMLGNVDLHQATDLLARGNEDAHTTAELHLAAALVHRRDGDLAAAERSIREGIAVVRAAGLRQEYIAVLFPWHATVLREIAEAWSPLDPPGRAAAIRAAKTAAHTARRWSGWYRNNAPHALRESGLVDALRGRHAAARRHLARSLDTATEQGAAYEVALTRLAIATLDAALGGPVTDVDAARAALAEFESQPDAAENDVTLSLSDRFAALLTVGRAIVAATSHPALEAAVRDAARALLRIEECHLVPITTPLGAELASQSGGRIAGLSRALVSQAVEQLVPVASSDLPEETNESLIIAGVRSALAAPITVFGAPTACLYVTHRDVGRLFGEEEVQLTEFVTTLAGAAYEHLAGSETRFRSLVQNSKDVITLIDRDGLVSYQSSAAASEFGFASAGLVGQPIATWVHPEDLGTFGDALDVARTSADTRVTCRLRTVTGEYRVCEISVVDLLGEPNVAAIVLTTRDITERTRFEEELVEKNLALEKAGKAKDMFLASMSHELRTPLNSIMGFTGTLLMGIPGPLNPEQERQLTIVEQNGTHLLSIINDLLDLARIESGQVQLTLREVDCGQVVADVLRTLEPLATEKGLALSRDVPEDPVLIRSDERALSQILINLGNNAIKFTDHGGVDVSVARDGDDVRISVTDTGIGIDANDLDRIFTAFARAKDSSRRAREGTGLGLHISQRLAELIQASIQVEAHDGAGTTFSVRLSASTHLVPDPQLTA